ncbi:MAG TPA: 4-hydroxythreonine-4-phosphate dehydrogenase PdxA [Rhodospirillaceae bacterium]|nr:4-hydroxythreonine-4-phosphate dehydrogenase PdxA [Rhodospirillaceae bacterium]HAA93785.1 4-hydroxythreonine-4-phosphate dehydrogenase PdxA [Rhodospirillaceae bacterium]HAT34208.1 4-hydroxythreonine-4-phosphate dehydrogenase PdxA [Rhodospirillaceae bacterium]
MGGLAPIALTMGEPAGIGGEIALKAWANRAKLSVPPFFVIDDPKRLNRLSKKLGWPIETVSISDPSEASGAFSHGLPVFTLELPGSMTPGAPDPANANCVISSIDTAVTQVTTGNASALVTNPIHKFSLYDAGFSHPGHTEYLAALAGGDRSAMMLACDELRVVPVTIHMSLAEAIKSLTTADIVEISKITEASLKRDFGIDAPHLMVAALNPHGGENGSMGNEERDIIVPAVEQLKKDGLTVTGPAPADTLFHPRARATYDAVICMYHDQALIPLKTIDFSGGVNITMGLPFVRTSPDHGTAFEIAGMGVADETSVVGALKMAAQIAQRRANRIEAPAAHHG